MPASCAYGVFEERTRAVCQPWRACKLPVRPASLAVPRWRTCLSCTAKFWYSGLRSRSCKSQTDGNKRKGSAQHIQQQVMQGGTNTLPPSPHPSVRSFPPMLQTRLHHPAPIQTTRHNSARFHQVHAPGSTRPQNWALPQPRCTPLGLAAPQLAGRGPSWNRTADWRKSPRRPALQGRRGRGGW